MIPRILCLLGIAAGASALAAEERRAEPEVRTESEFEPSELQVRRKDLDGLLREFRSVLEAAEKEHLAAPRTMDARRKADPLWMIAINMAKIEPDKTSELLLKSFTGGSSWVREMICRQLAVTARGETLRGTCEALNAAIKDEKVAWVRYILLQASITANTRLVYLSCEGLLEDTEEARLPRFGSAPGQRLHSVAGLAAETMMDMTDAENAPRKPEEWRKWYEENKPYLYWDWRVTNRMQVSDEARRCRVPYSLWVRLKKATQERLIREADGDARVKEEPQE